MCLKFGQKDHEGKEKRKQNIRDQSLKSPKALIPGGNVLP